MYSTWYFKFDLDVIFFKWEKSNSRHISEAASCVLYTGFFTFLIFSYNKFCFSLLLPIVGTLGAPQWWERTGTHNRVELPTYLQPYHLTGKVRAFLSLFITWHQLSILWKLLLDTKLPWNHREWQPLSSGINQSLNNW